MTTVRLTGASDGFIAALEKAQSDLEWCSNQIEAEFAEKHKSGQANPLDILTRINRLKREIPTLLEECTQLLQAKQTCVDAARHHLIGNTDLLNRLERKAGIVPSASRRETYEAFEHALQEHDSKLKVQYAGEENRIDRDALNQAFASSVVI